MGSRWSSAFWKTIIFLAIAHVIILITGFFAKTDIGIFNLPMWWAHWSNGITSSIVGIAFTIVLYFIIYFFFTHDESGKSEKRNS